MKGKKVLVSVRHDAETAGFSPPQFHARKLVSKADMHVAQDLRLPGCRRADIGLSRFWFGFHSASHVRGIVTVHRGIQRHKYTQSIELEATKSTFPDWEVTALML